MSEQLSITNLLPEISPFDTLSHDQIEHIANQGRLVRYRVGQEIIKPKQIPSHISIIVEGEVRLIGFAINTNLPVTLAVIAKYGMVGVISLITNYPYEMALAKAETACLEIPAPVFLELLHNNPKLSEYITKKAFISEAYYLLNKMIEKLAVKIDIDIIQLAQQSADTARVIYCDNFNDLEAIRNEENDREWLWSISNTGETLEFPQSSEDANYNFPLRIIGFPKAWFDSPSTIVINEELIESGNNHKLLLKDTPYADELASALVLADKKDRVNQYPFIKANTNLEAILACFQMLCKYFKAPFRREVIERALMGRSSHDDFNSLYLCAAVGEFIGFTSQMIQIPIASISQLPSVAVINWNGMLGIIYESDPQRIVLAIPQYGALEFTVADLIAKYKEFSQTDILPVLLIQTNKATPRQKFGLSWFLPYLSKYRRTLIEVLVASFFVQLFGLANPLVIQVLIDKVIVQGGIDTLNVLGIFLLIIALFEGVLSALRTFIFADTTNRIDFALGSEIIDRLYRLPLRFFEKRPVGEVATRVNELENIRQFMTGTALTVVLDAVFSVIYIVIMFLYNWGLSLVALSVIPLFIILTLVASPLLRSQLRTRAERNAEAQSHLVETLSGIQTVKGQNIELQSKWKWQQRYSNYIDASYRTVITSSTAGAISHFLEQLSGLVVLWVGANMVLTSKGEFTLGQLIAFRIIAGYVTSPLLRLVQLWQNFQETGLSLERLSDIVDTPTEVEMAKSSITLPPVQGLIQYEDVCFRFASTGPLQLAGVSITIPAGAFVGIVGQSGSGKSTLLKLLCRLYEPTTGRILVDNYDINKVDLYSVRSQLGMVPQEPLLFEGTIRENIALVNPEASDEEIIQAAKIAVAHEFIMNLPSGYDTRVGEKGSGLSGGQRQRIAIARTVLQNPRLLLLDEATSALDYDTERKVCSNLINHFRGKTVLFITHRLKVIQQADMILVMDHGVLEEQGTHQQLMEKRGRYFCLYQQQDSSIV